VTALPPIAEPDDTLSYSDARRSRMAKGRFFGKVAKKAMTRFMDRVGSKVVSGMADTSADAPSAHFEPKRDLYRQMKEGGEPSSSEKVEEDSENEGEDSAGSS
jgi:hypothetical protein